MTPPRRSLAASRAALFAIRAKRVRPGWDDKVLADWNGLMIAALANAAQVFEQPSWLAAAIDAFAFVTGSLVVDGRLAAQLARRTRQASGDARRSTPSSAAPPSPCTRRPATIAICGRRRNGSTLLDRHYRDENGGGYFFAADDTADIIVRTKNAADNATPSGNGTLVGVLARLFYLTGEDRYRERADEVIATFSGELNRSFFSLATLLNSNELLQTAQQIVIIGDRAARRHARPGRRCLRPLVAQPNPLDHRAGRASARPDIRPLARPRPTGRRRPMSAAAPPARCRSRRRPA